MNLSESISIYEFDLEDLKRAIRDDDLERIRLLDQAVSGRFEMIVNTRSDSCEESKLLFDFLINHLVPEEQRSPMQNRIVDRLSSLLRATAPTSN